MMNKQNVLKASLLMVLLLGLTACGSSKSSNDYASRASDQDISDTSKAWMQCNSATSASGDLRVNLSAYYDGDRLRNDLVYVRLADLPASFQNKKSYIKMFRWQANSAGSVYTDPTALSVKIVSPNSGAVLLSSRTTLKWSDIETLSDNMGYDDAEDFFDNVWIVVDLRDASASFDALMVTTYNSSGNTAIESVNALLPVFAADPTAYATDMDGSPRNSALQSLHPFKDSVGQGWTRTDYQTRADSYCSSF